MTAGYTTAAGFVFGASLSWTLIASLFSAVGKLRLNSWAFYFVSLSLSALLAWSQVDYAALAGGAEAPLVAVMALSGVFGVGGMLLLMAAMARGHRSGCWSIGQSAMLCSFAFAVAAGRTSLTGLSGMAMLLVVAGIALFGIRASNGSDKISVRHVGWLLLAILAFAHNGVSQSLSMLPSLLGWQDAANLRVPVFLTAGAMALGIILLLKKRHPTRKEWMLGGLCGTLSYAGQFCLYRAMDTFSQIGAVGLTYPLCVGGSVLLFGIKSRWFLNETFTLSQWVALFCCSGGIVLLGVSMTDLNYFPQSN